MTGPASGRRTLIPSIAAIGSIIAASSCCLPVLPFAAAARLAGSSVLLSAAKPVLLTASILLIACGFYQAARAKKCRRPSLASSIVLWLSALFVAVSIFVPQAMANAVADLFKR